MAFRLINPDVRKRAAQAVMDAPDGYMVVIRKPQRSLGQNACLWAMIGDVARAEPDGRRHTRETWKAVFMQACGHEVQFTQGLSGEPFPTGFRSSRLGKEQMSELITFIEEYGNEHSVKWTFKQKGWE